MAKSIPLMSSNVQNISKQDNSYSAEMNSKKISHKKQARRIKKQQELRSLYSKLKEVIPSCQTEPVSSLDIVLNAVDYINELHQALLKEYPGLPTPIPNLTSSSRHTLNSSRFSPHVTQCDTKLRSFRDVTNMTLCLPKSTEKLRN